MKKIIFSVLGLLIAQLAIGQIKIKVIGKVTGDTEGHNKVYLYNRMAKDSAEIKNGRFEINFEDKKVGSRAISIEYDHAKRRMYSPLVLFYDQSGTINVEFDVLKGLSSGKVSGLASATSFYQYNEAKIKVFRESMRLTQEKYGADAMKTGNAQFETAKAYKEQLFVHLNDSLLNVFVKPNASVSPVFIQSQETTLPLERLEYYYNKLSDKVKKSEESQTLHAKIQGQKNAYIGATVKNFELPDALGKLRNFNEFKGKYILLDFWASWCSPCRASFPRIREVYSKIKDKDFIVINISIDQNKDAWLKAVKEESNPWPQLYDDRKVSYSLFNVNAVPTSYLIDPSGKIIMKEIGFEPKGGGAMEKKLEELFKVKF